MATAPISDIDQLDLAQCRAWIGEAAERTDGRPDKVVDRIHELALWETLDLLPMADRPSALFEAAYRFGLVDLAATWRALAPATAAGTSPMFGEDALIGGGRLAPLCRARVLGLLAAATRTAVVEAFRYARARETGGRPIAQHQAVAVRLAELALAERAVALTAPDLAALAAGSDEGEAASMRYVAELGARIARDAVQVAGAHGYVEGLPFRRLFERIKTLSALLALDAARAEGAPS